MACKGQIDPDFGPREQTLVNLDVVGLIAGMELRSQREGRLSQMIGTIDINQILSRKACNSMEVSVDHSQMQNGSAAVILLIDIGPRILQEDLQDLMLLIF